MAGLRMSQGCPQVCSTSARHDDTPTIIPYLQPIQSRPFKRRRYFTGRPRVLLKSNPFITLLFTVFFFVFFFTTLTSAALIPFENCLPTSTLTETPKPLQWVPLQFDVQFDSKHSPNNLRVTTYGNVTGSLPGSPPLPPYNSPLWKNASYPYGKIVDFDPNYATLETRFDVASYTPFNVPNTILCNNTVNTQCPIAPAFFANASDINTLPGFYSTHNLSSSYAFSTIIATLHVISGSDPKDVIACVSAAITPDLGPTISNVIRYLPLMILILVGFKVGFAAICSPWGTSDPFRWTSNYGRDEDLLRLVTPSFEDCIQYLQFFVLAGSLSLQYPGFFQPVVSKVSWAALMFNQSFVSGTPGRQSLQDGVYIINGTYGLERMSSLVGLASQDDLWAGTIIWTLVIIGCLLALAQIAFFARWGIRAVNNTIKEDLRSKNWPFLGGMLVRIVCTYFILPLVALSLFQLVISPHSKAYLTALAAILIVLILLFGAYVSRLILKTSPRARLFDELPTVLLYGPLYNTYSDDKAPFALVSSFLNFLRGIAFGAVQPSGIAQVVILAVCEVIFIVSLAAFRPFCSPSSMNAMHMTFASVRLITILLSIAFVPTLGVSEGSKEYVGYVVLFLHALVMIFGFFLNAVQTIVEVAARLAGAGGEGASATRGGLGRVLGVRQLSRRRRRPGMRHSMGSEAAMLTDADDMKSPHMSGRSRSMSASSAILLNNQNTPSSRVSGRFDHASNLEGEDSVESGFNPLAPAVGMVPGSATRRGDPKYADPNGPYYRPPRPRRLTSELMGAPGAHSRSTQGGEIAAGAAVAGEAVDATTASRRRSSGRAMSLSQVQPSAAYLRQGEDSDPNLADSRNVDYAVREVDFYYGVRGPALSSQPTRKLKTGPADPVGTISTAERWFKGIFSRKTKDHSKGFEVVRSARAPPADFSDEASPDLSQEPYQDKPPVQNMDAYLPGQRTRSNDEERELGIDPTLLRDGEEEEEENRSIRSERFDHDRPPGKHTPYLDPIDTGGDLNIPSRFGSQASKPAPSRTTSSATTAPVPRKSSQRQDGDEHRRLSTLMDAPIGPDASGSRTPEEQTGGLLPRLPFTAPLSPGEVSRLSTGVESGVSTEDEHRQHGLTATRTSVEAMDPPHLVHLDHRPRSYGQTISQFRASPNIHTSAFRSEEAIQGSQAELIDSTPRPSNSRSTAGGGHDHDHDHEGVRRSAIGLALGTDRPESMSDVSAISDRETH